MARINPRSGEERKMFLTCPFIDQAITLIEKWMLGEPEIIRSIVGLEESFIRLVASDFSGTICERSRPTRQIV